MINLNSQEDLFKIIGERLKIKVECVIIGGSAMMYYGAKSATKDVDMVFMSKDGREIISDILVSLGYSEINPRLIYLKGRNPPLLLQFEDSRFDLFLKNVVSFYFTESVLNRIKKVYEYSNLIVKIASPEDIFLMKCATERAGDILDANELTKKFKLDWETVMEEGINQDKIAGNIYILSLYSFINELKDDFNVNVPADIMQKLRILAEEEIKKINHKSN